MILKIFRKKKKAAEIVAVPERKEKKNDVTKSETRGGNRDSFYECTCFVCGKKWQQYDGMSDGHIPKCPYCQSYMEL